MKFIKFSITRRSRNWSSNKQGYGCIEGDDIVVRHKNENGKYVEVKRYSGVVSCCRPIVGRYNQFKGQLYTIEEVEFEVKNSYETREIEVTYDIWFKVM